MENAFLLVLLSTIFGNSDLDELDPNPLYPVGLVNLQCESLAERQSVVVVSSPHEASVMRSEARSPALIQLESEDKLTRVSRGTRFEV